MAKENREGMEGELLHLHPKEIGVHPIIQFIEDNGAFSYSQKEIDDLVMSVKEHGFLQPILVTPSKTGKGPKFLRISGKMRVIAADRIGGTVPCFVREFPDGDEAAIVETAKAENFKRRLWNALRVSEENELINKIMSKRTVARLKVVKKLHPDLQRLVNQGILRHYSEQLTDLKELSYDSQLALAEAINSIKDAKVTRPEAAAANTAPNAKVEIPKEVREQIEKLTAQTIEYEKKIKEKEDMVKTLKTELADLKEENDLIRLEVGEKDSKQAKEDNVLAQRYQNQIKDKQTIINNKEAEITRLKNELYKAQATTQTEIEMLASARAKNAYATIDSNEITIINAINKIASEVEIFFKASEGKKDIIIVVHDCIDKMKIKINKEIERLDAIIAKEIKNLDKKKAVA